MEECTLHHPTSAINSLHNYFHCFVPQSQAKPTDKVLPAPKMHYASLNLASLHFHFGQFDEALLSNNHAPKRDRHSGNDQNRAE